MDLIRSFIEKTLKSEDTANSDYVKYVQQKAQQFIKAAQTPADQQPNVQPPQNGSETEPTA